MLKFDKTIVVSGAGGFLGKELVKQLINNGDHLVIALTSNVQKLKDELKNNENVKILTIQEWGAKFTDFKETDIFINCAFPRSSDPEMLARGLEFTEEILKTSIKKGITNIINISSQSVYSQKAKSTTNEETQAIPESFYGISKYSAERIVATICESNTKIINYSNIRLASLTGNELEVRMTNRFVKNVLRNKPLTINGGNQKVSYLDVRDAASALINMVNINPDNWSNTYNLGNNNYFTVLELAETVKKSAVNFDISDVTIEVKEGNDNFNNLINSDKFYKDFNWSPNYNMPAMVDGLFDYYKEKEEVK